MKIYFERTLKLATGLLFALGAGSTIAAGVDVNINVPGVYVPPQPVYVAPQPIYVAPRPIYVQSQPEYVRTETRYVDCKNGKCKDKKMKHQKHHKGHGNGHGHGNGKGHN